MGFVSDLIFPPRCIICDELVINRKRDTPFCERCASKWELEKKACRELFGGQPVTRYTVGDGDYVTVLYAVPYLPDDRYMFQNLFILKLKRVSDKRATKFAAQELASMVVSMNVEYSRDDTYITWVPRSVETLKRCGFDHMGRVAKLLARMLGIKSRKFVHRSKRSTEQKLLSFTKRHENADSSLYVPKHIRLDGKSIILIDDITTTGASIEAAARKLTDAGAGKIIALTLARTEHPRWRF